MYTLSPIQPGSREFAMIPAVWEASVRATHHFLSEEDILSIRKSILPTAALMDALTGAFLPDGRLAAFLGVRDDKIEMLFAAPPHMGQGLGKRLIQHAMRRSPIRYVDVNTDNPDARRFYEHMGFAAFRKKTEDDAGRPFPILHMRLALQDSR